MPDPTPAAVGELSTLPLPVMIERLGISIAEAQLAMDKAAVSIAGMLGNVETHGVDVGGRKRSLLELGFTPTFYHITEATVEVRVAFSMAQSSSWSFSTGVVAGGGVGFFLLAASVNASYASKYSFEASGASAITARITAVPPPALFVSQLFASSTTVTPAIP